jgi:drug/metabolite transporter superfamily protein YnfA
MIPAMGTSIFYIGAAACEIAGCFAFWAWLRLDRPALWIVPGLAALALFAYPPTRRSPAGPSPPMAASTSPRPWCGYGPSKASTPTSGT